MIETSIGSFHAYHLAIIHVYLKIIQKYPTIQRTVLYVSRFYIVICNSFYVLCMVCLAKNG